MILFIELFASIKRFGFWTFIKVCELLKEPKKIKF